MSVIDILSKRQKEGRGDVPEVYTYVLHLTASAIFFLAESEKAVS